jgi:hypothetical protein
MSWAGAGSRASAILWLAGNFLSGDKKSPKNTFFSRGGALSADSTSVLLLRTARIPARDHRCYKPVRRWYRESCNPTSTQCKPERSKSFEKDLLLQPHRPWLCEVPSYKILSTSDAQAQIEGDRAQEARGPRTARDGRSRTGPMREKRTFFGYFLPFSKKLPASRRIAESFDLRETAAKAKALDSRFRGNDVVKECGATLTPTLVS